MRPIIAHPKDKPGEAILLDLHATAYAPTVEGFDLAPGKVAQIALKAVAIKHLRAGELTTIDGKLYPLPCQAVATSTWVVNNPMSRGIYPDAAKAILGMDHGMECAIAPGNDFAMGKDKPGFNHWHLIIAWGWSLWQARHLAGEKWTLERRWAELQSLGYPDKFGAFRQVCSRLNLSVTKSRPIL